MDTQSDFSSRSTAEGDPPTANGSATANGSTQTRSRLTPAEQEARLRQFFKYWKAPAEDLTKCPPEAELLEAARTSDPAAWPDHIQHCSECRLLVELISDPARERIPAQQILTEASRLAWRAEHHSPRSSFTPGKFQHTFYNPLGRVQTTAVVAVLTVALGLAAWLTYNRSQMPPPSQIVKLNRDQYLEYSKAMDWFSTANAILGDEALNPEQKVARLQPLKSERPEIEKILRTLQLDDTQKADLGTLKATYNTQTTILTASLKTTSSKPEDLHFTSTPETVIVTQVWAAFGTMDGKPIALDQQDTKTAKALLEAAEYTEITKIAPGTSKTEVTVSFSDARDASKPEVRQGMTLLENNGVHVTVVPPNEPSRLFRTRATKFQSAARQ